MHHNDRQDDDIWQSRLNYDIFNCYAVCIILSVITLQNVNKAIAMVQNVVMLNAIMLSSVMLGVIDQRVVVLTRIRLVFIMLNVRC
jgi:hypothetical protein